MNTLATRIKERLDTLGRTQAGLAKYCKVQRPSVSKWLSGSTKTLQGQNLLRAAEFLECDAEWLADGKGFWNKNFHNGIRQEKSSEQYNIVALNDEQLVEAAINTYDVAPSISNINYTEEQYRRLFSSKEPEFIKITNIKVDNMSGTLETGDLVFIDTSIKQYDGDGIYLFVFCNHLHLKRLQMVGSSLLVISDNRQYTSWEIGSNEKHHFTVIGKVLLGQSQIFQRF